MKTMDSVICQLASAPSFSFYMSFLVCSCHQQIIINSYVNLFFLSCHVLVPHTNINIGFFLIYRCFWSNKISIVVQYEHNKIYWQYKLRKTVWTKNQIYWQYKQVIIRMPIICNNKKTDLALDTSWYLPTIHALLLFHLHFASIQSSLQAFYLIQKNSWRASVCVKICLEVCNEHGTFYVISSDFGDWKTTQYLD